jgi:hypothetical protein
MLFEGGVAAPPNNIKLFIDMKNSTVESIMVEADRWDLRGEVRATAIALLKDDPSLTTGSAYAMAAYEWDI